MNKDYHNLVTSKARQSKAYQKSDAYLTERVSRFRQLYKVDTSGCWLWTGGRGNDGFGKDKGYGRFGFGGKAIAAHRFSYFVHFGKWIKSPVEVCHTCDMPYCVNPKHLFLGSHDDNMKDMISKGRSAQGEKSHSARLAEEDVLAIREKYSIGVTTLELANEYNIDRSHIYKIINRKKWRHI